MAEIVPPQEGQNGADDFVKYHEQMRKEIDSLQKIADELDEVRSVDILQEWLVKGGGRHLPRPGQLKMLLEAFKQGLMAHFHNETIFLQRLERNESLKNLSRTFLGDHAKFTKELNSSEEQLKAFMAAKPEAAENLDAWRELLKGLKLLLNDIGDHAIEEEELIFKISHNM